MKHALTPLLTIGVLSAYAVETPAYVAEVEQILNELVDIPEYNKYYLKEMFKGIDPSHPPTAAFDHDGTLIIGDISVAMMYQQITSATFALPVDETEFVSILSLGYSVNHTRDECFPEGMETKIGKDIHNLYVTFRMLLISIFEDYVHLMAEKGKGNLSETLLHNLYAKFGFYNNQLWRIAKQAEAGTLCKHEIGLRELAQLWHGLTRDQLNKLIDDTWAGGRREEKEYQSTGSLELRGTQSPGVMLVPQQRKIIEALRKKNANVLIVTAAPTYVIQHLAHHYHVKANNVHGVRLEFDNDGKCTGVNVTEATHGIGKAKKLKALGVENLLFAAGDSMGDYEMLQAVNQPKGIKLIVNPVPTDEVLIELFTEACDARKMYTGNVDRVEGVSGPRVLVQGFDARNLKWIPTAYTTYGETYKYTRTGECEEYRESYATQSDLMAVDQVHVDNTPVEYSNHKSDCGHGGCSQNHHPSNNYGNDKCKASVREQFHCEHSNVATAPQVHAELIPAVAPATSQETR